MQEHLVVAGCTRLYLIIAGTVADSHELSSTIVGLAPDCVQTFGLSMDYVIVELKLVILQLVENA